MRRKNLRIGGASALILVGGAVGVASAQYSTSFPTGTSSSFASQLQLGQVGDNNPNNYPGGTNPTTAQVTWNSGSVSLTGDSYDQAAVALITSDGTSSGGGPYGVYGNTDAVLDFTILGGKPGNVTFGIATRVDGQNGTQFGVASSNPPLAPTNDNDYPLYRLDYAGGTLSLTEQVAYNAPTTIISDPSTISLVGGSDTYQLEMSTQGTGATETIVGTLSQNGLVVGTVSTLDPSDQIASGEVGFYAGGYGGSVYAGNTTLGIQATSFSVNASSVSVPEPASIGLLAFGAMGLLARRRDRKTV